MEGKKLGGGRKGVQGPYILRKIILRLGYYFPANSPNTKINCSESTPSHQCLGRIHRVRLTPAKGRTHVLNPNPSPLPLGLYILTWYICIHVCIIMACYSIVYLLSVLGVK